MEPVMAFAPRVRDAMFDFLNDARVKKQMFLVERNVLDGETNVTQLSKLSLVKNGNGFDVFKDVGVGMAHIVGEFHSRATRGGHQIVSLNPDTIIFRGRVAFSLEADGYSWMFDEHLKDIWSEHCRSRGV